MKTVLVLEDGHLFQKEYESAWRGKLNLLQAFNIKEAEKFVADNPGIDLIVVDACVPGNTINTKNFVSATRRVFKGPMIASSSEPDYTKELIAVGCNYEANKNEVPFLVLKLLNLE